MAYSNNVDYKAKMNDYISKGGKTSDSYYKSLKKSRNEKISNASDSQLSKWGVTRGGGGSSSNSSNRSSSGSSSYQSFDDKYADNISGLAKYNNVTSNVARDMLIANLLKGGEYKGGGTLDYNIAADDAKKYVNQTVNSSKNSSGSSASGSSYSSNIEDQINQLLGGLNKVEYDIPDKDDLIDELQAQLNQRKLSEEEALLNRKNSILEALASQENDIAPAYEDSIKQLNKNQFDTKEALLESLAQKGIRGGLAYDQQTKLQNKLIEQLASLEQNKNDALEDIASKRSLAEAEYQTGLSTLEKQLIEALSEGEANIDSQIRDTKNQQTNFDYQKNQNTLNTLLTLLNTQNQLKQQDFENNLALDKFNQAVSESDRLFEDDRNRWETEMALEQSTRSAENGGLLSNNSEDKSVEQYDGYQQMYNDLGSYRSSEGRVEYLEKLSRQGVPDEVILYLAQKFGLA